MTPTSASPPVLDVERIAAAAGDGWRPIEVVAATGSTNADLVGRCGQGSESVVGSVLLAEHQTAGRGRHGRTWVSPPGAQVAMSVALDARDRDAIARLGWVSLLSGVAVAEAIAEVTGVVAELKWPNDVLVGGAKVSGILAELAAGPTVVVGIGVNTGLGAEQLPVPTATSLNLHTESPVDRSALAGAVLARLGELIALWPNRIPDIAAAYRQRCITLGARVRLDLPDGSTVVATAVDVDDDGRLVVDPADGATRFAVAAGDVTHLRPVG
ncbi:biotin--[acetyl-CoA-carboxylase] ligase [Williamsia sp. CHRR-6]|uniref:biotin--[acetyl-CoA-carboxylase] ligase n=1 Tax=Williamsia sp. CHRR-6 TaxID=2835871 RepID=UPI001BDA2A5F|nr:biotin--[acetyl-CoA-carboxylase] ligase [Williamsia sp. CHRR-6]MBT0566878.1 biotin--[acetyl-CoA-carboxylase] ligase [Williamsia sp. CHRR-6]